MNFQKPKVSIGVPVYNGEQFIQKHLESLLAQTYKDFEIIISDNCSLDNTYKICQEFSKRDKRIKLIRQTSNLGMVKNFSFVLSQAKGEYFMWSAVDDIILPSFIEENLKFLELNNEFVGSISKISLCGLEQKQIEKIDYKFYTLIKKIRTKFHNRTTISIIGTYEEKVQKYLKKSTCQIIYGLFRIEPLKESYIEKGFVGYDWAINLRLLKFGDFNVIEKILMYENEIGESARTGTINLSMHYNSGIGKIIPWYPLTKWCMQNLERRIFLNNIWFFVRLNFEGIISQGLDMIRLITKKWN